jgi:hypothetical protein
LQVDKDMMVFMQTVKIRVRRLASAYIMTTLNMGSG